MTTQDPVLAAQQELNEAVSNLKQAQEHADQFPSIQSWDVVARQAGRVEALRYRYNSLCTAYNGL